MAKGQLVKVVRTCLARPSQWDAWRDDGQYLYLRYRHGIGSVEAWTSPDDDTTAETLTEWDDDTSSGDITLADFLTAAGLELAPGAQVLGEPAG